MPKFDRLKRNFFARDTETVAKDILGKYLVRETKQGKMVGKVIEVEAYLGTNDKASHTYNHKKTEKTKTMYEAPGTWYVYYIYGVYFCLNIITEKKGVPCAVFIRGLYPIEGVDLMKKNRSVKLGKHYKNLLDGPSKLCQAFKINKENFNGKDSCAPNSKMYFTEGESINKENIILGTRIGIDYAEEDKERLLRFKLQEV